MLSAASLASTLGEDRHIQRIGQQGGRLLGLIHLTQDQQAPCTLKGDGRHRFRIGQMRNRQKRSDFGRGVFGITAPSTGFANVDELNDRGLGLRLYGQVAKQALFLGAGHHHIVCALHGLQKCARLAATQRGVQRERLRQALAQCLGVQGLGLVAVANQRGHASCARCWNCFQ